MADFSRLRWQARPQILLPLLPRGTPILVRGSGVRSCGNCLDQKSERKPALAPKQSWNRLHLPFHLDLDDLEWLLAGTFRQVSKGIHVLQRPSFCLDLLTLSIRGR
jgi:hypothetical protein